MKKLLLTPIFCLMSLMILSQSVEGIWQTYDGSGELQSDVKLYIKNDKLYGKLIQFYNSKEHQNNEKCVNCKGIRKNKPLKGLVFMSGLTKEGGEWEGSKVLLDPANGKEYDGKIWLVNENKLAMRGYLGWLYETQYWKRKK